MEPPSSRPSALPFWGGFAMAIVGAVLFSSKAIVAKLSYRYGVDALVVIGLRMLLSMPFFALASLYQMRRARRGRIARLTRRDALQVAVLGCIGYYLASYLDFLGLQHVSAGLERLILLLSPTFVLLMTAVFLKRTITPRQWLALALSYGGVVLVFAQNVAWGGDSVLLGSTLVLGSALSYAVYLLASGELLRRIGASRLVAYAMTVSSVVTLTHFFLARAWQGLVQPREVYELALIHAVFQTVAPVFLTMWAVARIGAPLSSQLGMVGPVSVLFLANWLLGEPITHLQLVGTAVVLAGVLVLSRR